MKSRFTIVGVIVVLFFGSLLAAKHFGFIRLKKTVAPSACSAGDGHDHDHDHDHEEQDHEESEGAVHLTSKQRKLVNVKVQKAAAGSLSSIISLNGEIQLNMDATARLMPRMPGFVTRVLVKEGDKVRKGQPLAILTSHKLGEYYSDYNSSKEREKLALSEFEMAEKLRKTNSIAEKEFMRYKREYAYSVIARRRAEAFLKSLLLDPDHADHKHEGCQQSTVCTNYKIRAPFDGTVISKDITTGEHFSEDNTKVVFTVSNLSRLWLDLQADNTEMRQLQKGEKVSVSSANSARSYSGEIVYVSPVINEATRTGLVRVMLDNSKGELRPGEFATGTIQAAGGAPSIILPRESIQLISGETVVFVPEGDSFVTRVVSVGKSVNNMTQVISGLKAGDKYVASGAFELKSILLTAGMDPHAGHGH